MRKMQAKINQLGVIFCAVILLSSLSISGESLPLIKSTKVDNPKSVLFIGNSFFYYNNGVHKPVLGMVKANKTPAIVA